MRHSPSRRGRFFPTTCPVRCAFCTGCAILPHFRVARRRPSHSFGPRSVSTTFPAHRPRCCRRRDSEGDAKRAGLVGWRRRKPVTMSQRTSLVFSSSVRRVTSFALGGTGTKPACAPRHPTAAPHHAPTTVCPSRARSLSLRVLPLPRSPLFEFSATTTTITLDTTSASCGFGNLRDEGRSPPVRWSPQAEGSAPRHANAEWLACSHPIDPQRPDGSRPRCAL